MMFYYIHSILTIFHDFFKVTWGVIWDVLEATNLSVIFTSSIELNSIVYKVPWVFDIRRNIRKPDDTSCPPFECLDSAKGNKPNPRCTRNSGCWWPKWGRWEGEVSIRTTWFRIYSPTLVAVYSSVTDSNTMIRTSNKSTNRSETSPTINLSFWTSSRWRDSFPKSRNKFHVFLKTRNYSSKKWTSRSKNVCKILLTKVLSKVLWKPLVSDAIEKTCITYCEIWLEVLLTPHSIFFSGEWSYLPTIPISKTTSAEKSVSIAISTILEWEHFKDPQWKFEKC